VLYGHVGRAAIKSRTKIMSNMARITFHLIGASYKCHAQFPMARHNNIGPTRVVFPALVMIGIVWDSAVTPRLAIVILIIAIVCFSLAVLFFLRRH
jgi:hypothetical protein